MTNELKAWEAVAVNLPEHARNPIHTDEGAIAEGFPGALVAGVSTYAYATHVPATAWGLDWIGGGGAEVRLRAPVFDKDNLVCTPSQTPDGVDLVEVTVDGQCRVPVTVWLDAGDPVAARDGQSLRTLEVRLGDDWRDYGKRLGEDFPLYETDGIVHPAAWPALANDIVHNQLVTGSWIHTRSRINHHGIAKVGSTATVESVVVDRFSSPAGERALLDITIRADDEIVATIEHEAIISVTR